MTLKTYTVEVDIKDVSDDVTIEQLNKLGLTHRDCYGGKIKVEFDLRSFRIECQRCKTHRYLYYSDWVKQELVQLLFKGKKIDVPCRDNKDMNVIFVPIK